MSTKTALQNTFPVTSEWRIPLLDTLQRKLSAVLTPEHERTTEDLDCKYCLYISEKTGRCMVNSCVCLPERLRARCVAQDELYGRLFTSIGKKTFSLLRQQMKPRKRDAVQTLFVNSGHYERWRGLVKAKEISKKSSDAFAAALFLLTADNFLWSRAKHHLRQEKINFRNIDIRGVSLNSYAIFKAAKELYSSDRHISVSELADPNVISDSLLRLIINSLIIRRHGVYAAKS